MGGQNNWRPNVTFDDWMRDMEKRILSEERRPIVRSAADLLGPGAGPFAVETPDWDADETAFNGNFYSIPGAQNAPDPTQYWIGTTEGTPDGNGYELVRAYDPFTGAATGDSLVRFFHTTSGQRLYGDWLPSGGGGPPPVEAVEFTFASAATTWVCPHNLNSPTPDVFAFDGSGIRIYGDVTFIDINNLEITWYRPTAGRVRIEST